MWSRSLIAVLLACSPVTVLCGGPENPRSAPITDATQIDGCSALAQAGLGHLLVVPQDAAYTAREKSYWAPNAALGPKCILLPLSAKDVSQAMKVISASKAQFAVRSGGHVQWAGGSDVKDGITIDFGNMTNVTYNPQTTFASVQPGPRWGDVFTALEPYGVGATGGRDADVGIGGFLTGGGNAYLSGRNGFGCDAVVNFEVVLANGAIINANKTANADLWKALKGGWANYGIVTRFDIETTPNEVAWGGPSIHEYSVAPEVAAAFVKFTDASYLNPQDAHLVLATYNTVAPKDFGLITVVVDTNGVANASAFTEIQAIPSISDNQAFQTLGELAYGGVDPSDDRVHWFTLTFNNDLDIVNKALELHEQLVSELNSTILPDGFSTQCVLQPIPSYFGEIGARKGGNVLGLDSVKTNSVLWLGTVAYQDPAHDALAHEKLEKYARELENFAKSKKGDVAWRYINYSDKTQNPLKSYGKKNIDFIKRVAAKYDPNGVFQKQMPGSFKISKA